MRTFPAAVLAVLLLAGMARADVSPQQPLQVTVEQPATWNRSGLETLVVLRPSGASYTFEVGLERGMAVAPVRMHVEQGGADLHVYHFQGPVARPMGEHVAWPAPEADGRSPAPIVAAPAERGWTATPWPAARPVPEAQWRIEPMVSHRDPQLARDVEWSNPHLVHVDGAEPLAVRILVPMETAKAGQAYLRVVEEGEKPVIVDLDEQGVTASPSTEWVPGIPSLLAACSIGLGALGLAWMRCREWDLPVPAAFFWLFTRLRRPEVLEHPTRRRIHDALEAEPGAQYSKLRKRLGLPAGVLTHHLGVLEAHGLVTSLRLGSKRHLYAGQHPLPMIQASPAQRILAMLAARPLAQDEIACALPASRQAVGYHLHALLAEGLVQRGRDRDGRWVYHAPVAARP